ncbi:MAG: sulfatase-like hydrolase/transferase [Saccharofermentanales bacterium]
MGNKPNILVFMTDHQRGDMAPPYNRAITPHLDEFFKSSSAFTNAYCTSPHCCPSRASFFSGLYPSEHGVWNNVDVGNTLSRGLNEGIRLFSEDLMDNGYAMYFSGKWHVSAEEGPRERGFSHCYPAHDQYAKKGKTPDLHEWDMYKSKKSINEMNASTKVESSGERLPSQLNREGYPDFSLYGEKYDVFGDEKAVDAGCAYILKAAESATPWFNYIGVLGPHDPYYVAQEYLDRYPIESIRLPENFYDDMHDKPSLYRRTRERFGQLSESGYKEAIRHYLAFCTFLDNLFGKVVDALKQSGQYENTVILYTSDHGDYVGEHGLFAKGLPCFKGAYHIPLLIGGGSGYVKARGCRFDELVSITDMAPTILDIAGIPQRTVSGRSLAGFLHGQPPADWRDAIFTQSNGNELYGIQRSVMTSKWKYVYNGFDYDELYDLMADPGETINLAREEGYSEVIREMSYRLWTFAYEHKETSINPYVMVSLAQYGPGIIF